MLKTRIIPVLLLKNGILVRSRQFSFHQSTGNHIYQVERFSDWRADEIIYLDISRDDKYDIYSGNNVIGATSSKNDSWSGEISFPVNSLNIKLVSDLAFIVSTGFYHTNIKLFCQFVNR